MHTPSYFYIINFFFHTKKYVWNLKGQVHSYFNIEKYFLKLSKLTNIDGEATTQALESIGKKSFYFL
jgi:hypothetical protein